MPSISVIQQRKIVRVVGLIENMQLVKKGDN